MLKGAGFSLEQPLSVAQEEQVAEQPGASNQVLHLAHNTEVAEIATGAPQLGQSISATLVTTMLLGSGCLDDSGLDI